MGCNPFETPSTPDLGAAAQQQGAANEATARLQGRIGNPNIINPYGTQKVDWGGTVDQAGYDAAMAAWRASPTYMPKPDISTYTTGGDQPTITQTLNPESQKIFDATLRSQQGLANLGNTVVGTAQNQLSTPFQYQGPAIQTSIDRTQAGVNTNTQNAGDYLSSTQISDAGNIQGAPNLASYGRAGSSVQRGQIANAPESPTLRNAYESGGNIQTSLGAQGNINQGPQTGQYGYAAGLAGNQFGSAQGGPAGNQFGSAQGGPTGDQFGRAQTISADRYGLAAGIAADKYGLAKADVTADPINQGPQTGQYGYARQETGLPTLQGQLDTSNVAAMPVNAGMTGQQAIMSRLQPQIEQQTKATEARLANQGIVQGSEAYNNAMRVQNQSQNDLLTQAALQGINLDLTANNQGFGQSLASGQFTNQAALSGFGAEQQNAQLFNQGLGQNYNLDITVQQAQNAAQNQKFNQGFGIQNLQNQAVAQNFGQGVTAQQLQNSAIGQNFGQGIASQELQNRAVAQNFSQAQSAQAARNAAIAQNFGQGQSSQQLQNASIGQNFGQGLQGQQLTNQAVGQNYGIDAGVQSAQNAAQQQAYLQSLGMGQFANQAQGQQFGQNQELAQFFNSAEGQQYQQQLAQQAAQNAAQQQGYTQNRDVTGLQNSVVLQNQQAAIAQQLAANQAQAQQFGQNATQGQFYNQGQQQNFQNQLTGQEAYNQAQAQQYNQGLAGAQFGNTAQQQAYTQQLQNRALPLNEISALMSGTQVQNPQFQGYQGGQVQPTNTYNAALQQAGMQNANQNAMTSGLFGLGASALMSPTAMSALGSGASYLGGLIGFSDRRLKSKVERIGTHPLGIGIYEYDIFGHRERGVMADEVLRVKPNAVSRHASGYLQVDYGRL